MAKFVKPTRVYVWSREDLQAFLSYGIMVGRGTNHETLSQYDATELTSVPVSEWLNKAEAKFEQVYAARWVHLDPMITKFHPTFPKFSAIIENDPMHWGIAKSAGFDVHQLVHG